MNEARDPNTTRGREDAFGKAAQTCPTLTDGPGGATNQG